MVIHILSDISDHFSQFCILKSVKDKANVNKFEVRNFSQFSADGFNTELSQVDWNVIVEMKLCDVYDLFSSFHNKFNKRVNKHAPMKTISNRKAKQFSKPWITQGLMGELSVDAIPSQNKSVVSLKKMNRTELRAKFITQAMLECMHFTCCVTP